MLNIREKIGLDGIISFLEAKIDERKTSRFRYNESVMKFLQEELEEVLQMRETLNASSAEEDHMKATYSRVKSMHEA